MLGLPGACVGVGTGWCVRATAMGASLRGWLLGLTLVAGLDAGAGAYWPGPGDCMAPCDSDSVASEAGISDRGGRPSQTGLRNRRRRRGGDQRRAFSGQRHLISLGSCAPSAKCGPGGHCGLRRAGLARDDLRARLLRLPRELPGGGPARKGEMGGCALPGARSTRPSPTIAQRNVGGNPTTTLALAPKFVPGRSRSSRQSRQLQRLRRRGSGGISGLRAWAAAGSCGDHVGGRRGGAA